MNEPLVICMVDGLRFDYTGAMPFLQRLGKTGTMVRVVPPLGFEPDGAIWAGLSPAESNLGFEFGYSPTTSPYRWVSSWFGAGDKLDVYSQHVLRRLLRFAMLRFARTEKERLLAGTYQIPLGKFSQFDRSELWFPFQPFFANGKRSVFKALAEQGKRCLYWGYPLVDCRLASFRKRWQQFKPGEEALYFFYISDLDAAGHKYGPKAIQTLILSKQVDNVLRDIDEVFRKYDPGYTMLVFGDHGMVEVSNTLDMESTLAKQCLADDPEVVYFMDSTACRIWTQSKRKKAQVIQLLPNLDGVVLVDPRSIFGSSQPNGMEPDVILWCEEGWSIYPDFWHRRKAPKGMHGYAKDVIGNHTCLVSNKRLDQVANMHDIPMKKIFHIIMHELGATNDTQTKRLL